MSRWDDISLTQTDQIIVLLLGDRVWNFWNVFQGNFCRIWDGVDFSQFLHEVQLVVLCWVIITNMNKVWFLWWQLEIFHIQPPDFLFLGVQLKFFRSPAIFLKSKKSDWSSSSTMYRGACCLAVLMVCPLGWSVHRHVSAAPFNYGMHAVTIILTMTTHKENVLYFLKFKLTESIPEHCKEVLISVLSSTAVRK